MVSRFPGLRNPEETPAIAVPSDLVTLSVTPPSFDVSVVVVLRVVTTPKVAMISACGKAARAAGAKARSPAAGRSHLPPRSAEPTGPAEAATRQPSSADSRSTNAAPSVPSATEQPYSTISASSARASRIGSRRAGRAASAAASTMRPDSSRRPGAPCDRTCRAVSAGSPAERRPASAIAIAATGSPETGSPTTSIPGRRPSSRIRESATPGSTIRHSAPAESETFRPIHVPAGVVSSISRSPNF